MPSKSKYDEYDVNECNIEDDVYSVDIDEDGNPFINPELHNLGTEEEKIVWHDSAYEDITSLYEYVIHYRDNIATSHLLEKLTYNRFLQFVSQNSFKYS